MAAEPAERGMRTASAGDALEEAILSAVPPVMLPPLLAPSAGAFAAAAAIGFGFANQMAGAYLGFLKGAMESNRMLADALGVTELDRASVDAGLPPVAMENKAEAAAGEGATILPMQRKKPVLVIAEPAEAAVAEEPVAETKTVKARSVKGKAAKPAKAKAPAKQEAPAKASAVVKADNTADLKRIAGIGPKLEKMLKARGFATLGDIAALTNGQAEALDRDLGLDGRIARDGWIEAAKALV